MSRQPSPPRKRSRMSFVAADNEDDRRLGDDRRLADDRRPRDVLYTRDDRRPRYDVHSQDDRRSGDDRRLTDDRRPRDVLYTRDDRRLVDDRQRLYDPEDISYDSGAAYRRVETTAYGNHRVLSPAENFRITDSFIFETKPSARSTAFDIRDGLTYKKLQTVVNDCVQDCGGRRDIDAKLVYKRLAPFVPYYGTMMRGLSVTNMLLSAKLAVTNSLLALNHGCEDDPATLRNVLSLQDQDISDDVVLCADPSIPTSELVYINAGNPMPCAICNKKIFENQFAATPLSSCATIMHESCFIRAVMKSRSEHDDTPVACPCKRCSTDVPRDEYLRYLFKFDHNQRPGVSVVSGPAESSPFCNDCLRQRGEHVRMTLMKNQKTGNQFYGCPNWSQFKCRAVYSQHRRQTVADDVDRRPTASDDRRQTANKREFPEHGDDDDYQRSPTFTRHHQGDDRRPQVDDRRHQVDDRRHRSDNYEDYL